MHAIRLYWMQGMVLFHICIGGVGIQIIKTGSSTPQYSSCFLMKFLGESLLTFHSIVMEGQDVPILSSWQDGSSVSSKQGSY